MNLKLKNIEILNYWFNVFSLKFFTIIFLIFISGILEGFSILSLLPLIETLSNNNLTDIDVSSSELKTLVFSVLNFIGINFSVESLLLLLISFQFFKIFFLHCSQLLLINSAQEIADKIRQEISKKCIYSNWLFFTSLTSGSVTSLMSQDAPRVMTIYRCFCAILNQTMNIIIYFSVAVFISLKASFYVFIFGMISILILRFFSSRAYNIGIEVTKSGKEYLNSLTEFFNSFKIMKMMEKLNFLEKSFINKISKYKENLINQHYYNIGLSFLQSVLIIIFLGSIIFYSYKYEKSEFSEIIIFLIIIVRAVEQVTQLQRNYHKIIANLNAVEEIKNFLGFPTDDTYKAHETEGKKIVPSEIKFNNVAFSYKKSPLLTSINIKIPKNKLVAIIGTSGIGKSTIFDLLAGLIKPESGEILFDKTSSQICNLSYFRSNLSYVPQDNLLINNTLKHNIILDEKLIESKYQKIITDLKLDGINSKDFLGEKGVKLSAGQRQRISIARALYRNSKILILDEPTSNLDKKTSELILKTLKSKVKNRVILIISHNNDILHFADIVYQIKNGRSFKIK